jgi:hypothetical protein
LNKILKLNQRAVLDLRNFKMSLCEFIRHSWLKGWMRRFHGVAIKYLENYLGGRRMLVPYKTAIPPKLCLAEAQRRPIKLVNADRTEFKGTVLELFNGWC